MAKNKRQFNQKARQNSTLKAKKNKPTVVDTVALDVDFEFDTTKYDDSNALILPTEGNNEQDSEEELPTKKKKKKPTLSRKERKRLEKVLERKNKKSNREHILSELQKYQLKDTEYKAMCSASSFQTKGLKRHYAAAAASADNAEESEMNSNPATRKSKRFKTARDPLDSSAVKDLNVISFNADVSSESEGDDFEDATGKEFTNDDALEVDVDDKEDIPDLVHVQKPVASTTVKLETEKVVATADVQAEQRPLEPTFNVTLTRPEEIEAFRRRLPIVGEEQAIVETIRYNDVVVICGETGSGKTTQVPQFLYEAGYARERQIAITEPRRVAAISMASRVGEEMGLRRQVSYHIRYENNVNAQTKIKFMTDGVLLREVQKDFLLNKYSVIIIDEAHERSVFSDVLIGLLSRIIRLRAKKGFPLKLIIMSATLRIDDFTANHTLFKDVPPVIKINARQFPVAVHFSKTTPDDYMQTAYSKICKIHRNQPEGGILVFVTGKNEVNQLCRKLKRAFPKKAVHKKESNASQASVEKTIENTPVEDEEKVGEEPKIVAPKPKRSMSDLLPKFSLDDYKDEVATLKDDDSDMDSDAGSDGSLSEDDYDRSVPAQPLYCLPLFSGLPKHKQTEVFKRAPEGTRLCIISTNIAETSLTIPDIKYVVDTGKVKTKVYDKATGISTFIVEWCSQASSDQRAGRAGRTSAGSCYRLFSSAVFKDQFSKFSEPEIARKPIDDLFLQMKALDIDNIMNFPFPTPPSIEALRASEQRLITLGALEADNRKVQVRNGPSRVKLTPLGRIMAKFPISPRYSKMMSLAYPEILPYVIAITSAFTVQEIFLHRVETDLDAQPSDGSLDKVNKQRDQWLKLRQKWAGAGDERLLGDAIILLKAIGASEFAGFSMTFCARNGLRHKAIIEIHKLRKQLTSEVNALHKSKVVDDNLTPPNELQGKHMRQIMLTGFCDHVARRIPNDEKDQRDKTLRFAYKSIEVESPVFIDPSSILKDDLPEFIVYQEIHESASKMYMRNVIAVNPAWLPIYATSLCSLSKPLEEPEPYYDSENDDIKCFRESTFGPYAWPLPVTEHVMSEGLDKCRWFGRFLLEGKVHSRFEAYTKSLLSPPSILNKSWSKLQPRTTSLVNALALADVHSLSTLRTQWKKEPTYLKREFLEWVPSGLHAKVETAWNSITK